MKKIFNYLKNNIFIFLFTITTLINGFIVRYYCGSNVSLKPLIGDLIVVLLIGLFGYLTKKKKLYYVIWSIILTGICMINSIYYNNYTAFVSISLFQSLFQALDMPKEAVTNVFEFKDYIFLFQPILMIVMYIIYRKKELQTSSKLFKRGIMVIPIIIIGFIISLDKTDIYRFNHFWNREYTVNNFGIYTYQLNDIYNEIKYFICPNCNKEKAIDKIDEFFEKKETTPTNEYTNIFKDKNIIVIHAESIASYLLNININDKELMPNLKKLATEGIYFSNFYSQEDVGNSSDSELTFSNSLLPITRGTFSVNYPTNSFYSIASRLDYYAFSMHANQCSFWKRNIFHYSFDYDKFYCYKDAYEMDDMLGLGLSDKSFFNQSIKYIKENSINYPNYYAELIMLSNHTPFLLSDSVSKYDVSLNGSPYLQDTTIGHYFELVHYADEAIGELIDSLDKEGLLDNTVIVLYGDHDAKLKKDQYDLLYNYDEKTNGILKDDDYVDIDFYKYELDSRVPFIIWTKDQQFNLEVDEIMGMVDTLPTLANMFGFDASYTIGHDIFSDYENVVVFSNGNWVTDNLYYNGQRKEYKILKKFDLTDEYINKFEEYSREVLDISNKIIKYNYFKKN